MCGPQEVKETFKGKETKHWGCENLVCLPSCLTILLLNPSSEPWEEESYSLAKCYRARCQPQIGNLGTPGEDRKYLECSNRWLTWHGSLRVWVDCFAIWGDKNLRELEWLWTIRAVVLHCTPEHHPDACIISHPLGASHAWPHWMSSAQISLFSPWRPRTFVSHRLITTIGCGFLVLHK